MIKRILYFVMVALLAAGLVSVSGQVAGQSEQKPEAQKQTKTTIAGLYQVLSTLRVQERKKFLAGLDGRTMSRLWFAHIQLVVANEDFNPEQLAYIRKLSDWFLTHDIDYSPAALEATRSQAEQWEAEGKRLFTLPQLHLLLVNLGAAVRPYDPTDAAY